jgi:peptidyl-dipeptidase A
MRDTTRVLSNGVAAAVCSILLAACSQKPPAATAADAQAFVKQVNADLTRLAIEDSAAGWVQDTYITDDTQLLAARASERVLAYFSKAFKEATRFKDVKADEATMRSIKLLLQPSDQISAPAPDDPVKRNELTTIMARMEGEYGAGKYCTTRNGKQECRNIDELSETIAESRNYDELTDVWTGWHSIGRQMRQDYARFVELANEGSREIGFKDLGEMWRAPYDMTPAEFEAEVERLWGQVKPLYEQMHCYARAQLAKKYGEAKVPAGKSIPAQLFGNLWAQQWNNIYEDILKPYPAVKAESVNAALERQHYSAGQIVKQAESFYTSLGMRSLPESFWERSMFVRPRDRDVVCHASAWHMDFKEDVRIKECVKQTQEDLETTYHELGHVYYYLAYKDLPYLFENGANDGFHEAIGDTVVLSMTPGYLSKVGLIKQAQPSQEAIINHQMKIAADKIAFLPFGKLIDQWRWGVFSGQIKPADYTKAWWDLRQKYQGVAPPVPRTEEDFDPGAKYHVPGNTPYTRYFLSFILQFQFHRALCQAAGFKGPLHECSIFGSKEAGEKFEAMLAAGASRPWAETLEKLTGSRQIDASAIIEYFQPLMGWLKEKNAGQTCTWEGEA